MNYLDYKPRLDKTVIDKLSVRKPLSSGIYIMTIILLILVCWYIVLVYASWMTYISAFVLIGVLQHHLLIIQHESLHFFLFKSRAMNNLVGSVVSYLIGFTMRYRKHHFRHHRSLGSEPDPDYHNYRNDSMDRMDLLKAIAFNLTGLSAISQFLKQADIADTEEDDEKFDGGLIGIVAVQLIMLLGFYALGHWHYYIFFWLLPLITLAKTISNFRNLAEHILRPENDAATMVDSRLRTIECGWLEKIIFAPMNFNFHAEHHLFLSVPYQHLPELHAIAKTLPGYSSYVDVQNGYLKTVLKYTAS